MYDFVSDEKASVQFEIYVDKRNAPLLHSGKEKIDDILVLHLQGGKDLFVSLSTDIFHYVGLDDFRPTLWTPSTAEIGQLLFTFTIHAY